MLSRCWTPTGATGCTPPFQPLMTRTPLEAVQETDGRDMVMALLEDMERREQHLGMGIKQQASMDRAREQLGLQS